MRSTSRASTIFILIFVFAISLFGENHVIKFFSRISGERDFYINFAVRFHVFDNDSQKFIDSELGLIIVIRDMRDFYIYVTSPNLVKGINFLYFSERNTVYSGYSGKYYIDRTDFKREKLIEVIKDILEVLTSPVFFVPEKDSTKKKTDYIFKLSSYNLLKRLGLEPISLEISFGGDHKLKSIKIYGKKDEYVMFLINRFSWGKSVNADNYFLFK